MIKNRKRLGLLAAAAVLILTAIAAGMFLRQDNGPERQGNLLENGDFSAVRDGQPEGWHTGMWITSPGVSYLEATEIDGRHAVLIENAAGNDARYEQEVDVRENATYRLSAKVRAEGCDPGLLGANLSVLDYYGSSNDLHETNGQWEDAVFYFHTGKRITHVTVLTRLGGYGNETTGKAWFTDVSLEQVDADSVPVGAAVLNIEKREDGGSAASASGDSFGKTRAIPLLLAAAAVYLIGSALIVRRTVCLRGGDLAGRTEGKGAVCALLLLALAIRLILAGLVRGYGVDMGCFGAWAGKMAAAGPGGFYSEGYFCDYPPAYMLVLGCLGKIAELFGLSFGTVGGEMLLKSVPILCDLVLAWLLYTVARREIGVRAALGICALAAFNPAYIVSGACWGQIDAVLTVLLCVMLLQAAKGNWTAAITVFALAVLAKPQAGLLVPLGVAALIKELVTAGKKGQLPRAARSVGLGIAGGLAVTLLVVLPFSKGQSSPLWLADKYIETLSSYNFATLSTGNLMFLLGGNWVANTEKTLLGLSYGTLGMGLMILSFVSGILVYLKGRGRSRLMLASALTLQLIFVLGSKMHERYIMPALILLLLAWLETGDALLLGSALLCSAATAVNVGVVLAYDYLIAPNLWLGYVLGAVQLLAAGMTCVSAVRLSLGKAPVSLPETAVRTVPGETAEGTDGAAARLRRGILTPGDHHMHFTRKDAALMLLITGLYACVGFWHLGATSAPQTGYASSAEGETVVIDLGEERRDFRIYYYGGISDTGFSFAVSRDGEHYGQENAAFFDRGECFKWQALRSAIISNGEVTGASGNMLTFTGRYLRVTFDAPGSALWEVGAVSAEGECYGAVSAESAGAFEGRAADPMTLIDEQDTVPELPTWYNSMYFDEIYHARTGYEHAKGLYTYETTHPPLGKVLMSLCIQAMGMTPFAWRFAGTLAGVLMIPAIYLLAMQLFKKTRWAVFASLLLALDCMHFTQTRLATIDSFPVLFMMLMFLFMARWTQMDFFREKLSRTFVPLLLSGIFMGLAIASKWIGVYGAAGLAVLFFVRFFGLLRQSLYAGRHRDESPEMAAAADTFIERGAATGIVCVICFILIPVAIYLASYIPYMRVYGGFKLNAATLERIWEAQLNMFDYHKNLHAEHYFASPWYEWPLIIKPMWYYSADFKGPGMASSILSFGNPAVWWVGLAGMLYVLVRGACRGGRVLLGRDAPDEFERPLTVLCIGFLSAYLPWVLVSRLTFIYHYFASVPFIILSTAQAGRMLERRRPKTAAVLAGVLIAAALALFIAFFPLASGLEVSRSWCDAVSWFDNWMWY